jgi:rhodanese-related sulfurtransferase
MMNRFGKPPFPEATPQEVAEKMKSSQPLVLDVREPWEYSEGHIAGSALVPLGQLPKHLNEFTSPDQEIIVVCRSGGRSGQATMFLMQSGYTNVTNMAGGMLAWEQSKLPVEK